MSVKSIKPPPLRAINVLPEMKQIKTLNTMIPLVVLIFGFLMILFNLVSHSGDIVRSLFLKVEHPLVYHFTGYNDILKKVVSGHAVNYEVLKADPELNKELNGAVNELSKISPDQLESAQEQTCFWINTYNLLVLKAVTDLYPTDSIMSRKSPRAFNTTKFLIGATELSLQDIFKGHLIPAIAGKPEDLFLTNGGAQGFPPLLDHAIVPKTLEADAAQAASSFVNNPENAQYKRDRKTFILTPFFKWHEGLFDSAGGPHEWANNFLPSSKAAVLTDIQALSTYAPDFNWRLNDTKLVAPKEGTTVAH
jgi:hypothetical protein